MQHYKENSPSKGTGYTSKSNLRNRFGKLYVEDPEDLDDFGDDDLDTEALEDAMVTKSLLPTTEETASPETFELDQPDEAIDMTFIVYCFLEDLHKKQEFIKTLWQDYAENKLDLRTAALVTNVACQLVDVKEIELLQLLPEDPERCDFDIIMDVIIPEKDGELRDVDDEMCDRTYFYEDESYNKYKNMLWERESEDEVPNVAQLASIHPNAGKLMHDHDRLLSQMWFDLDMKHQGEQHESREMRPEEPIPGVMSLPFLDEITEGLDNVHIDSEWSSFPAAFKARVCLNINDILGSEASKAYEMLRYQAALANAAISINCGSGHEPTLPSVEALKPHWGTEEVAEMAISCATMIKKVFVENFHVKWKIRVVDAGGIQRARNAWGTTPDDQIWPFEDTLFFQNHNPVYCGMERLRLTSEMEKLGIEQTNKVFSFIAIAHIYDASKKAGQLQGQWASLENAIEVFKDDLFGSELLLDEEPMQRLSTCLNSFASDSKANTSDTLLYTPSLETLHTTLEMKSFSKNVKEYLSGSARSESFLHAIYQTGDNTDGEREGTQIELLVNLRDVATIALPRMEVDLVTLNKQCSKILAGMQKAIRKELGADRNGHESSSMGPASLEKRMSIAVGILNRLLPALNRNVNVPPMDVVSAIRRA